MFDGMSRRCFYLAAGYPSDYRRRIGAEAYSRAAQLRGGGGGHREKAGYFAASQKCDLLDRPRDKRLKFRGATSRRYSEK